MTNNDDFEQQGLEHIEEMQGPPTGLKANLVEAWRSQPLFKLVVLMTAVAAVVAAGVGLFSSGSSTTNVSRLTVPPSLHEAPGGPVSPFMKRQTELANDQRTQKAIEENGSALPTPIGADTGIDERKNDSLTELKTEIERLRQQQVQEQQKVQQQIQMAQPKQPPGQPEQFDDSLSQAMQQQMREFMHAWTPQGVKVVSVELADEKKNTAAGGGTSTSGGTTGQTPSSTTTTPQPTAKIVVPAGTVSYAQLLTEANSDVPGPILAQIVSGPLSGARAIGHFQVANGYNDYLVLQFSLASSKGKEYAINAIALDPDTTLGGMATEVDQRYFIRVVLPAASAFLQGFGQALGQGGSSTVTNGTTTIVQQGKEGYRQGIYQGLGQGASTLSQFFQSQANTIKPLVRVAAGTPMGFFFITSVTDQQPQAAGFGQGGPGGFPGGLNALGANPLGQVAGAYLGANYPGGAYPGGVYPGATVAGYGAQGQNSSTYGLPYPGAGGGAPYPNYGNAGSPYPAYPSGNSVNFFPGAPGAGTTVFSR